MVFIGIKTAKKQRQRENSQKEKNNKRKDEMYHQLWDRHVLFERSHFDLHGR